MQERYCTCGKAVQVMYEFGAGGIQVRIKTPGGHRETAGSVCPCCGRRLDIHTLR